MSDTGEPRMYYNEKPFDLTRALELQPGLKDPSNGAISGRIVGQFQHVLSLSDLSESQKSRCSVALEIICAKLFTIWELRDSYAALEDKLIEEAKAHPAKYGESIGVVGFQDLYRDFDLFSVQVKSVLDHVVFFLKYGVGLRVFGFHKKGAAILNQLEKNLAKDCSPVVKSVAKNLAEFIRANEPWLQATINTRDDFNHYTDGKYHPNRFVVFAVTQESGTMKVVRPEVGGKSVRDVMNLMVDNILVFVEYFIGVCLCPKVTKLAIIYDWDKGMLQNQFSFGPWEAVDGALAAGLHPALVFNDRVGGVIPGFPTKERSGRADADTQV
jgi:hypothetical protein